MGLDLRQPFDSTQIDADEAADLIPKLTTLQELNEFEAANILQAQLWLAGPPSRRNVLDRKFLFELHRRMFGQVWRWAGTARRTQKNIGVEAWRIESELKRMLDDAEFWIEHSSFEPDEIAARFHHRLVWIHIFPNGNGRHARTAADLLCRQIKITPFTWGANQNLPIAEVRNQYLEALRQSDLGYFDNLINFIRS